VIDRDIHKARALLVEGNALLRSVTAGQLRNLGIGHVGQASKPRDARLLIEQQPFDIIICNREFEGQPHGGQDLLDELRREGQLPYNTVFMMVTSEAYYHHVVEAAEASLDGILVTPFKAGALSERLGEARQRKRELADMLSALDSGKLEVALQLALRRWHEQKAYAGYCGRIVAELLLKLNRADEAIACFEQLALQVAKGQSNTWATLGRARGHLMRGDLGQARRLIAEVQTAEPHNADAHDLMGRIQVELCDLNAALASYLRSAELTPGCLLRAQHTGALAFYQGDNPLAAKSLERAVGLGLQSKLFDALSLAMIAMLRFDNGDAPGVLSAASQLGRYRERYAESARLQRMEAAANVVAAWVSGQGHVPAGMEQLRTMSAQVGDDGFDLEAANLLLGLWSRAPLGHFEPTEYEALLDRLAMRFCTSKAIAEVLAAAARRGDQALAVLQRCQTRITGIAEQAMDLALRGNPAAAVQLLLEQGTQTLNAKLLEMCVLLTRRHGHAVPDADASAAAAGALLKRCCSPLTHIAGIQRTGRSPGGLQLRGQAGRLEGGPALTVPSMAPAAEAALAG
jgi:CheY-like chemotaxis protein